MSAPCVDLSIAIVTFRSDSRQLEATLRSLARALRHAHEHIGDVRARLLILDNGAASAPLPEAAQFVDSATRAAFALFAVVRMGSNIGFGLANNRALKTGIGDFHLVLNPDIELDQDALSVGIAHLQREPGAVLVVPDGRDDAGRPLYLAKRYPSLLVLLARALRAAPLDRALAARLADYEMHAVCAAREAATVPLASGCCMLLRGSAFRAAGGFTPGYFLYFEDYDLSLRLARMGSIVYLPQMRVVHHGGNAARKGIRHLALFCASMIRFFNAWGWRLY
jgi:hypothetical protein